MPFNQVCTYWAPGSPDGYGGTVDASPALLKCRWQDKQQLIRGGDGKEITSSAVVYLDRAVSLDGKFIRGDYTNYQTSPSEAKMVLSVGEAVGISGKTDHWKVYL